MDEHHALAAAAPGSLLFHRMAGKGRTGVIAALLLALAGGLPACLGRIGPSVLESEQLRRRLV